MRHQWLWLVVALVGLCTSRAEAAVGSYGPGGLAEAKLFSGRFTVCGEEQAECVEYIDTGTLQVWNNREAIRVKISPLDATSGWAIKKVDLYVGTEPVPVNADGFPVLDAFPYREVYATPIREFWLLRGFDEFGFRWGEPYAPLRTQYISAHAEFVQLDDQGGVLAQKEVWTFEPAFEAEDDLSEEVVVGTGENQWTVKVRTSGRRGNVLEVRSGILSQMLLSHWGYFTYEMAHPRVAHIVDSPVGGLGYKGPTQEGVTDLDGAFDYFPGERVELAVGSLVLGAPLADHKVYPTDIFEEASVDDPRVGNMARLLQSLDADGNPQGGIHITPEVVACVESALIESGLSDGSAERVTIDWSGGGEEGGADPVQALISETLAACEGVEGVTLNEVSFDDAVAHLDTTMSSNMFRKNTSRTPELPSSKAKLEVMGVWIPAQRANGDAVALEYRDEDGEVITAGQTGDPEYAKPLLLAYTDADPLTGDHDIYLAISRDDGNSWKRKNLSRMADRTSFTLATGEEVHGHCKKPVIKVKGNYALIMWTSKFARGGKPRYAIKTCPAGEPGCIVCNGSGDNEVCEPDYTYDDPYAVDDIWGVQGPQRSVDYTEEGFPEVGEVPYSAVWACRVVVDKTTGDITYYKPERLTSGRRDAYQLFLAGAGGVGFAAVWQEDPKGLRPGDASGPGPGWGGATTSHKTDIWYSFINWADFAKVDANFVIGGDPQHDFGDDFEGRPKALVPMSLPVRVTDNDALNTDNLMVQLDPDSGLPLEDADGNWIPLVNTDATSYDETDPNEDGSGSHRYGYMVEGMCESFYQFVNNQGATKRACVTADGRLLDGDTGASRPNIFLQPSYRWVSVPDDDPATPDVVETTQVYQKSAYAIIVYEETKGVGSGPPDHEEYEGPYGDEASPDEGKNAHYHSFDFGAPDQVRGGDILNHPETDAAGNPVYIVDEFGDFILDFQGNRILAYENARRPRLVMQPKSKMGPSKTVLVALYKEGEEGKGRPSDIMLRRVVADSPGNPYAFSNFVCDDLREVDGGRQVCVRGAQNVSSAEPTLYWTNPYAEPDARGDQTKVVRWEHRQANLGDKSGANPYDDARAHRGALRGDFLVVGYTWTPNWAASRNAHDTYNFYIRRSFDGGQSWTTMPAADGGLGVTHEDTFKIYSDGETEAADGARETYTVVTTYEAGAFEAPLNLSRLKNNKTTVVEPRIVAVPGQIWKKGAGYTADGTAISPVATGYPEDLQDTHVYWVAYGTAENLPKSVGADAQVIGEHSKPGAPLDLYYTFTRNRGESYHRDTWVVNPDSDGNNAGETVTRMPRLAKGDPEQGECQLRMTPDGSRFYASWLQEGLEGNDIWMRRIMPRQFTRNQAGGPVEEPAP